MTNPNEWKLAEKITAQQELEEDIRDSRFQLEHTKYEISNLKDTIIEECRNSLEEKQQEIENLRENQK